MTFSSVLRKGALFRTTGSTDMNLTSSRSHAIFTLILRQKKIIINEDSSQPNVIKNFVSKFNFVDLAGSERVIKKDITHEVFFYMYMYIFIYICCS